VKKISVHKKLPEQIKLQNIRSLQEVFMDGFQHSIYPNQIFGDGKGENLREEHAYIYSMVSPTIQNVDVNPQN
jgi:hypothetical protein